jgi:multiple sugar transport system substrate-binding protein
MGRVRMFGALALAGCCAVVVAGCGGSSGGGPGTEQVVVKGAKAGPDPAAINGAKGDIAFCTGKDLSGDKQAAVQAFNERYGAQGMHAKLLEFPEAADQQHDQFVQRQEAKSGECDVFFSDVIWTPEFAAQGWLLDMSKYVRDRQAEFIPSTLSTIKYGGRYWGVPKQTDAGFLYYRTDHVPKAPATWQQVYAAAKREDGIVYQGGSYEGGTVDFLELAYAAGGQVLSGDGKKSVIASPQNERALTFMVNGIKQGAAPKATTTYDEEAARRAFEAGTATFMRNWPYAYGLDQKAPKIKGKFAVAPLPAFDGGGRAGVLGGHNLVISAYSAHPAVALAFINLMTSPAYVRSDAIKYSQAPVLKATYQDPGVRKAMPFAAQLEQAVEQAKSRPSSPVYPQISAAIYKNVNAALAGNMSPHDALSTAQAQINQALKTF